MDHATHLRFGAVGPAGGSREHARRAEQLGYDAVLLPCAELIGGPPPPGIEAMATGTLAELRGADPSLSLLVAGEQGPAPAWLAQRDRAFRGDAGSDAPPGPVYAAGAFAPDAAAGHADVWLVDGQPLAEVARHVTAARRLARPDGLAPLRFGLRAYVIARETDAEAAVALGRAWERDDRRARRPQDGTAAADLARRFPHIGQRGGTAAGLVGSYATVAVGIRALADLGIELLVVELDPAPTELARFAEQVIPRVRAGGPLPAAPSSLGDVAFAAPPRERRSALTV